MAVVIRWICVSAVLVSACGGCSSVPTSAPPAPAAPAAPINTTGGATINVTGPPPQSSGCNCNLCSFLGLNTLCAGVSGAFNSVLNCLGTRFPGLEATPALTAIADPANLKSSNPAVATAAEVKAQEDAAPQKIKALNYLAKVGCVSCYPDIEKAFLTALDDCTESVRFAAVDNLCNIAGRPCQCCGQRSCCTPALRKRLMEVAGGINEKNRCFKESSPRVRRLARLTLERCCCPPPPEVLPIQQNVRPEEGPGKTDIPTPPPPAAAPAPAAPPAPAPAPAG